MTGGGMGGSGGGAVDQIFIDIMARLDSLERELRRAEDIAGDAGEAAGSRFSRAFESSAQISGALAGIAAALVGAAGGAVVLAAQAEQSAAAFETLLGSGEKAKAFLGDLSQFAAETPFELKGLQDASRKLLAFGFEAKQILPMMRSIGDAVGSLGGGAEEISRVTMALGQMQAKGKVSAEEMMQLAELGIPVWQMLADKIGVTVPEAMKMAESGAISAGQAIPALLEGMTDKFGGAMEKQASTLAGLWSSLSDNVAMTATSLGNKIVEALDLKGVANGVIEATGQIKSAIEGGGLEQALANWQPAIVAVGGALAGVLAPALYASAAGAAALIAPLLPFIAVGAAIALALNAAGVSVADVGAAMKGAGQYVADLATKLDAQFGITQRLAPIIQELGEVARAAFAMIGAAWEQILKPAFEAIAPVVTALVAVVADLFRGMLETVKRLFSAFTALINGDWTGFLDNLSEAVRNIALTLSRAFEGVFKAAGASISGVWTFIADQLAKLLENIVKSVTGWQGSIRLAMFEALEGAVMALKEILPKWFTWGQSLADGLLAGVRSRKEAIQKEVGAATGAAEDADAAGAGGENVRGADALAQAVTGGRAKRVQGYGVNAWQNGYGAEGHNGVDYRVGQQGEHGNDKIMAAFTGYASIGQNKWLGNYVELTDVMGQKLITAHLAAFDKAFLESLKKAGGRVMVQKGTVLGQEGQTGNAKGAHLHLGARNAKGQEVDPGSLTFRAYGPQAAAAAAPKPAAPAKPAAPTKPTGKKDTISDVFGGSGDGDAAAQKAAKAAADLAAKLKTLKENFVLGKVSGAAYVSQLSAIEAQAKKAGLSADNPKTRTAYVGIYQDAKAAAESYAQAAKKAGQTGKGQNDQLTRLAARYAYAGEAGKAAYKAGLVAFIDAQNKIVKSSKDGSAAQVTAMQNVARARQMLTEADKKGASSQKDRLAELATVYAYVGESGKAAYKAGLNAFIDAQNKIIKGSKAGSTEQLAAMANVSRAKQMLADADKAATKQLTQQERDRQAIADREAAAATAAALKFNTPGQLATKAAKAKAAGDLALWSAIQSEIERRASKADADEQRREQAKKAAADKKAAARKQIADKEAADARAAALKAATPEQLDTKEAAFKAAGDVAGWQAVQAERDRRAAASDKAQQESNRRTISGLKTLELTKLQGMLTDKKVLASAELVAAVREELARRGVEAAKGNAQAEADVLDQQATKAEGYTKGLEADLARQLTAAGDNAGRRLDLQKRLGAQIVTAAKSAANLRERAEVAAENARYAREKAEATRNGGNLAALETAHQLRLGNIATKYAGERQAAADRQASAVASTQRAVNQETERITQEATRKQIDGLKDLELAQLQALAADKATAKNKELLAAVTAELARRSTEAAEANADAAAAALEAEATAAELAAKDLQASLERQLAALKDNAAARLQLQQELGPAIVDAAVKAINAREAAEVAAENAAYAKVKAAAIKNGADLAALEAAHQANLTNIATQARADRDAAQDVQSGALASAQDAVRQDADRAAKEATRKQIAGLKALEFEKLKALATDEATLKNAELLAAVQDELSRRAIEAARGNAQAVSDLAEARAAAAENTAKELEASLARQLDAAKGNAAEQLRLQEELGAGIVEAQKAAATRREEAETAAENARYEKAKADAQKVGGDLEGLETAHQIKLTNIASRGAAARQAAEDSQARATAAARKTLSDQLIKDATDAATEFTDEQLNNLDRLTGAERAHVRETLELELAKYQALGTEGAGAVAKIEAALKRLSGAEQKAANELADLLAAADPSEGYREDIAAADPKRKETAAGAVAQATAGYTRVIDAVNKDLEALSKAWENRNPAEITPEEAAAYQARRTALEAVLAEAQAASKAAGAVAVLEFDQKALDDAEKLKLQLAEINLTLDEAAGNTEAGRAAYATALKAYRDYWAGRVAILKAEGGPEYLAALQNLAQAEKQISQDTAAQALRDAQDAADAKAGAVADIESRYNSLRASQGFLTLRQQNAQLSASLTAREALLRANAAKDITAAGTDAKKKTAVEAQLQRDLTALAAEGANERRKLLFEGLDAVKAWAGAIGEIGSKLTGNDAFKDIASGVGSAVDAFKSFSSGDIVGGIMAAFSAVESLGTAILNLSPGFQAWRKGLLDVLEVQNKALSGGNTGLIGNPFEDALKKDAASREKLANAGFWQRAGWALFGGAPQAMEAEAAKALAQIKTIFDGLADGISDSLKGALMEGFRLGDFSKVGDKLRESLQENVIKIILDKTLEAALAAAGMAEKLAGLADLIKGALASGDWSGVSGALEGAYAAGMNAVNNVTPILSRLPGYGYGRPEDTAGAAGAALSDSVIGYASAPAAVMAAPDWVGPYTEAIKGHTAALTDSVAALGEVTPVLRDIAANGLAVALEARLTGKIDGAVISELAADVYRSGRLG